MKKISLTFLILFFVPVVAYASWWNPFSWKIFSKFANNRVEITTTNSISATSTDSEIGILICKGEKWDRCPEGQKFVCPKDESEAFCEKISNDIKIPKLREEKIKSTSIDLTLQVNKNNEVAENLLCAESEKKLLNILEVHKKETESVNAAKEIVANKYESARQELFQQLSDHKGVFYIDPSAGFSPDQIKSQGHNELYRAIIDGYAMEANRKIEEILIIQKNANQLAINAVDKIKKEYPKCPISNLDI